MMDSPISVVLSARRTGHHEGFGGHVRPENYLDLQLFLLFIGTHHVIHWDIVQLKTLNW